MLVPAQGCSMADADDDAATFDLTSDGSDPDDFTIIASTTPIPPQPVGGLMSLADAVEASMDAEGTLASRATDNTGTAVGTTAVAWHAQLRPGSRVTALDVRELWCTATVIRSRGEGRDREFLVHYKGWKSRWDEWLLVRSGRLRACVDGVAPGAACPHVAEAVSATSTSSTASAASTASATCTASAAAAASISAASTASAPIASAVTRDNQSLGSSALSEATRQPAALRRVRLKLTQPQSVALLPRNGQTEASCGPPVEREEERAAEHGDRGMGDSECPIRQRRSKRWGWDVEAVPYDKCGTYGCILADRHQARQRLRLGMGLGPQPGQGWGWVWVQYWSRSRVAVVVARSRSQSGLGWAWGWRWALGWVCGLRSPICSLVVRIQSRPHPIPLYPMRPPHPFQSRPAPSTFILLTSCAIPSCPVLPRRIQSRPVLRCLVLSCPVLSCPVAFPLHPIPP